MPHSGFRVAIRRAKAALVASVTDNFDRFANGTTLSGQNTQTGGKTWTTPAGYSSAVVQSGKASTGTGGGANLVDLGAAGAQSVSAQYTVGSDVGNAILRLVLRSDVNLTNWIELYYDAGNGLVQIYRRGSSQLAIGAMAFPAALAVGATATASIEITALGAITAKINGSVLATGTDNTLSGTYVGFRSDGIAVGTTGNAIDSFASPAA